MVGKGHGASELLETAERRAMVLRLRRGGATYPEIAAAVAKHYGLDRLPNGWDERYAYKDIKRELDKLRSEINESAEDVRELELQRLDAMLKSLWNRAYGEGADYKAVDRVLRIMERRSNLLGLDKPERHDVNLGEIVIKWPEPEPDA